MGWVEVGVVLRGGRTQEGGRPGGVRSERYWLTGEECRWRRAATVRGGEMERERKVRGKRARKARRQKRARRRGHLSLAGDLAALDPLGQTHSRGVRVFALAPLCPPANLRSFPRSFFPAPTPSPTPSSSSPSSSALSPSSPSRQPRPAACRPRAFSAATLTSYSTRELTSIRLTDD